MPLIDVQEQQRRRNALDSAENTFLGQLLKPTGDALAKGFQQGSQMAFQKDQKNRAASIGLVEKGFVPAKEEYDEEGNVANASDIFKIPGNESLGYWTKPKLIPKEQKQLKPEKEKPMPKVPAKQAVEVNEPNNLNDLLNDLDSSAPQIDTGPISGYIQSHNPFNEKVQAYEAQIRSSAQRIGKYLEGGVLRKEDEIKYAKILPKVNDTPEVRRDKIDNVRRLILSKQNNDLSTLQAAGYDIGSMKAQKITPPPKILSGPQGNQPQSQSATGINDASRLEYLRAKKAGMVQ